MRILRELFAMILLAAAVFLLVMVMVSSGAEPARGDDSRGILTLDGFIDCREGPTYVFTIPEENPGDAACGSFNVDGDWWFDPEPHWTIDLHDYAFLQTNCPGVVLGCCAECG